MVRICLRLGLITGLSELEILRQIDLFERRLRGPGQTTLALPYTFHTWPGSGVWAERDKREVNNVLHFGLYTPEIFLDLGMTSCAEFK